MGDRLMCYRRKLSPMEIVTLLGLSKAFLDRVPKVVYSLYARPTPLDPQTNHDQEAADEAKWLAGHYTPDGADAADPEPLAPP
jgi:hypothetical protein